MKKTFKILLVILAVMLISAAGLTACLMFAGYGDTFDNSLYDQNAFSGKKVLFLSPHEDDDLIIYGSTIRLFINGGADTTVAFYSSGDYLLNSSVRMSEAIAGLNLLGVPSDHIVFLGYADRWTSDLTGEPDIYNSDGDTVYTSTSGHRETYAEEGFSDFHSDIYGNPAPYTRNSILKDFSDLILQVSPDIIFCVDLDSHPDHRTVSLLFEEALCSILKQNPEFRPKVFKGFSYAYSMHAPHDFYGSYLESSLIPNPSLLEDQRFELDMPAYRWKDRIRFPVVREALTYTLHSNLIYQALHRHWSQNAVAYSRGILNGDQVFFERRTDSLLYSGEVILETSSGDSSRLNDFKLYDTRDIRKHLTEYADCCWAPSTDDPDPFIRIVFPSAVSIDAISLFDDFEPENNILGGTILFSDGTSIPFENLSPLGDETFVSFPERTVDSLVIRIEKAEGNPGLSEIAVYPSGSSSKSPLKWVKFTLTNQAESFLYRYYANPGDVIPISFYCYPETGSSDTVSVSSDSKELSFRDSCIFVSDTAASGSYRIRAISGNAYDEIEILVGKDYELLWHRLLAVWEKIGNRFEQNIILPAFSKYPENFGS